MRTRSFFCFLVALLLCAIPAGVLAQVEPEADEEEVANDGEAEEEGEAEEDGEAEEEGEAGEELPVEEDEPAEEEAPAEDQEPEQDKPAAQEKPAEEKPVVEEKPAAQEKPAEEKPAAEKPAEEKPAAEKPAEEKPAEEKKEEPKAKEEKGKEKTEGVKILKKSAKKKKKKGTEKFTAIGATPLDREDTVLRIAVGYPEVQVLYHMPWDTDIEIAGGGGFFYGYNPTTAGDVSGFMGLMEGRWRFWKDGEHSMAVTAAPALYFQGDPDFAVGLVFGGPGFVYDYEIKGKHHAVLGASVPWGLFFFDEDTLARIPVLAKMGMEFSIAEGLHVFATSEAGADIWTGGPEDEVFMFVRVLGGAAFVM